MASFEIYVDQDGKQFNPNSTVTHDDVQYAGNILEFPAIMEELGIKKILVEDVPPEGYVENPRFFHRNLSDIPPYVIYTPRSPEECAQVRKEEVDAYVERTMLNFATSRDYLTIDRCVSYAEEPAVRKYQREGQVLRAYRSIAWEKCYEIEAQVLNGERPLPSLQEVIAELPDIEKMLEEWPA